MKRALCAAGIVLFAVLAGITTSYGLFLHRQFQSKVEWSVLQAADAKYRRNSNTSNVILYADSEYHLAGIINAGKKPILSDPSKVDRVWILLDSKYPPVVKILNTEGADYNVSKSELEKILAYTKVNLEVTSVLSKHIR
jgi:hypothetical protein